MDIEREVQSAMPALMERVKAETLKRIEAQATDAAVQAGVQAAREWAAEVLAPEIRAQLEAGKASMVAQAETFASRLAAELTEAIAAQVKKNLASSWNVRKVVDAIVGN